MRIQYHDAEFSTRGIMSALRINGLSNSRSLLPAVLLIVVSFGMVRCQSTIGGGQVKADAIVSNLEEVQQAVNQSNMAPQIKQRANELLNKAKSETKELGQAVDNNKKIADDNKKAADTLFWLKIIGGIIAAGAIGLGIKKLL